MNLTSLFPMTHPTGASLRRVFVFPGQGSQRVGMGKELYDSSPTYRSTFDRGADALAPNGVDLRKLVFEGPVDQLTRTLHAQPALLVSSIAFLEHLRVEEGIEPSPEDLMAGHSLGEWTAYVASGALTLEQGALAVYWRGRCMEEAFPFDSSQPRPMAVVLGLPNEVVVESCARISRDGHVVVAANFNAPGQVAISGHPAAVQEVSGVLREMRGVRIVEIPVAAPFHSPVMQPARDAFAAKLLELGVRLAPPKQRIIANYTAEVIEPDGDHIGSLLNQLTGSVRWSASMVRAWKLGAIQMVSVDVSGDVLLGLTRLIFSAEMPVQSVDPRIAMHRAALRAAPGVIRTTVFPPSKDTSDARLVEFSYDAGAVARTVRALLAAGDHYRMEIAVRVMDNPYYPSRDAGLRQMQRYLDEQGERVPVGHDARILAELELRHLEWPPPVVRDLPTIELPVEARDKLVKETFAGLIKQGLAPLDEEDLLYFVASRWGGDSARLEAILGELTRIVGLTPVRLLVYPRGPEKGDKGLSSWEHVVLAIDYNKKILFPHPGAMRGSDKEEQA